MPIRLNNFIVIILIVMGFLLSGCVTIYNPATQRRETLLIDTKSEVALGADMDRQLRRRLRILEDPSLKQRLNLISHRIANASDRRDLVYHFNIVNDNNLNAFALPGGFIYVNSGLMNISTDDELACVLAHEVGHIAARHSVKKLQANLGYQIIINIALGISNAHTLVRATNIAFDLVNLGYSRKDEFLADRLAIKYAKRGGFDAYGMVTFFEKLKEENKKRGPNFNIVFLSSHPPIDERIRQAKKEIENVSFVSDRSP